MMPKLLQGKTLLFVAAVAMQAKAKNSFRFGSSQNIVKNMVLAQIQLRQ
jgi:hypothetical protein